MLQRFVNRLQLNFFKKLKILRSVMDPVEKGEKRCSSEDKAIPAHDDSSKKQKTEGNDSRKRKCAIIFGYNGKGYHGLQRNPGFRTIEEALCKALMTADLIPLEHFEYMQKMSFQRAARTDKGVSAAGNCVSLKMLMNKENLVDEINSHLPKQIKVFDCFRTTNNFNAKNSCDARTYIYILPTYAFLQKDQALTTDYRMDASLLEKANEVLEMFRGTHNFHNYTSGLSASNDSAKRFIMDFECRTPFVRHGVEFCEISVKGQSFMLHQIRKMVGTMIAVLKGYVELDLIEESFKHGRICLPKAPGLGLVLDKLHYYQYNKRFGSDHKHINFDDLKEKVQPFKEEAILSDIYKTELEEYSMLKWLPELEIFTFDINNGENLYKRDDKMKLKDERSLITNKFIYGPDYKPPVQAEVLDSDQSTDPKIDSSANQEAVSDDSTNENGSNMSNEKEASEKSAEKTACDVKGGETDKIESAIEETAR